MKPAIALFIRVMLARSYPRVVGMVRVTSWVVQETVMPLLSVSAFALVYRSMGAPQEYIGFVLLGGAMTAFWLNVLWSMGAQLYWERDSGNLELYIMSPAPMMAILAGMALGGIAMTLIRATVILVAGSLLFDVHYNPTSWWAVAGVVFLMMLALYGLGMVFSSAFLLWGREAWHMVNLLQEPIYMLSGMNYPLRTLPPLVASLAVLIPLAAGMDALRQILFPPPPGADLSNHPGLGFLPVSWELAILAVLAVAFIALAHFGLQYLERRAREEGRLTVKWQ
jgi:ABC-2 type transport system permease protein